MCVRFYLCSIFIIPVCAWNRSSESIKREAKLALGRIEMLGWSKFGSAICIPRCFKLNERLWKKRKSRIYLSFCDDKNADVQGCAIERIKIGLQFRGWKKKNKQTPE